MKIETKTYKLKEEFFKILKIPTKQWALKKEQLLSWFENFFDYEILEGSPIYIQIKEVYTDYKPLPRKTYSTNREEKLADYAEFTKSQLTEEFQPTSKRKVARDAIADFGLAKYGHECDESVANRYITPAFNKYAESDGSKVWVWYPSYQIPEPEIVDEWRNMLKAHKIDEKSAFDREMDYYQGEANLEVYKQKKNEFLEAREEFKKKHGGFLVYVSKYKRKHED